jgi:hypothetical protein
VSAACLPAALRFFVAAAFLAAWDLSAIPFLPTVNNSEYS